MPGIPVSLPRNLSLNSGWEASISEASAKIYHSKQSIHVSHNSIYGAIVRLHH